MVSPKTKNDLRRAYQLMRARFGHQHWWPGETAFEVCVGAILTQNTAWTNVERAIANLKAARVLEPGKLFALPEPKLAELIRPAGYFNVKARRLRSFLRVLVETFGGDLKKLFAGKLPPCAGDCWPSTVSGRRRRTACCFTRADITALWLTPTRNGFFSGMVGVQRQKAESRKQKNRASTRMVSLTTN